MDFSKELLEALWTFFIDPEEILEGILWATLEGIDGGTLEEIPNTRFDEVSW